MRISINYDFPNWTYFTNFTHLSLIPCPIWTFLMKNLSMTNISILVYAMSWDI